MADPIDTTTDEWKNLSDEERYAITQPVCERFVAQFGKLSNINYISHAPHAIYVGTSLPEGTLISEMPATYEGIPVEQDPVREAMDRFIATWTAILSQIAGWTQDQIATVANDGHLCFRSAWFLHYSPIELMPKYLRSEKLSEIPGTEIPRRIEDAITDGISDGADLWHPDLDPKYDWAAARERVATANRIMERKFLTP
ncbi:MAG: hypothetical protein AB8G99_21485 [Planctomycetaceae bacterium]